MTSVVSTVSVCEEKSLVNVDSHDDVSGVGVFTDVDAQREWSV